MKPRLISGEEDTKMKIESWLKMQKEYEEVPFQNNERHNRMFADLKKNYPVYFSRCVAVKYDTKAQCYVGTFSGNSRDEDSTMRLTDAAAEFLLANMVVGEEGGRSSVPQVFLEMKSGKVTDVLLMVL
jgi:hypothetical protein